MYRDLTSAQDEQRVTGLLGFPLGHSISPVFQQTGFDVLGLRIRYELWPTPADALPAAVERLRRSDCLGANVTVPYKQAVIPLVDAIEAQAATIGAINTIRNDGTRLIGSNTDVEGFLRSIRETGFDLKSKRATLLGAGGAARAAAFALAWAGVGRLTILARRREQADALAASVVAAVGGIDVGAGTFESGPDSIRSSELIVNSTPIGMLHSAREYDSPIPAALIPTSSLVFDLVYNPRITPLLRDAAGRGAQTLGGLRMLVYQGVAAFETWTGQTAPATEMLASAERALGR